MPVALPLPVCRCVTGILFSTTAASLKGVKDWGAKRICNIKYVELALLQGN